MHGDISSYLYVAFHIGSIIAALAAGVLWMRSAAIKVPDIAPYLIQQVDGGALASRDMRDIERNLEQHRQALEQQGRFNRAAAGAASAAAAAQAATFALNLMAVLAQGA